MEAIHFNGLNELRRDGVCADFEGCQRLWRSVLWVAVRDLKLPTTERQAKRWIRSRSFEYVCGAVDLDPHYVRKKLFKKK